MSQLMTVTTELGSNWEVRGDGSCDPCEWVNRNIPKIKSFLHKRNYVGYSPYELDEFISQAYLAAIEAESKARSNCRGFEYYFWVIYKNHCRQLTYTKGYRVPCYHEEYIEEGSTDNPPTRLPEKVTNQSVEDIFKKLIEDKSSIDPKQKEKIIKKALSRMLPLERKVWRYLLKGYKISEIARKMGYRRQRIQKLRNRGLERAVNALSAKGGV